MTWPITKIGDVCDVVPGFAFKSKDLGEMGIPVIKIGNITDNRAVDIGSAQSLPEDLFENRHKKYLLKNGDILIAMTGATAGKVGRIRCAEDQVLLLNQRVAKLYPTCINPDFLWSVISTDHYRTIFYGLGGGAAQPNMSGTQIESVDIPCPLPAQQSRIASILSAYDDLIENNRRRIALLEQAARLLYKEWFVHLRFPGHEHTKIKDGVPEGWPNTQLPDVIKVNPKTPTVKNKEIYYVPMSSLSESGITANTSDFERRTKHTSVKFKKNDVLLARITPCLENGKTGLAYFLDEGEVACGSTEFIILRGKKVSYSFTYCLSRSYLFRENAIKSMVGSSGRQRVQVSCFDEFSVPLPPKHLLDMFDDITMKLFEQIKALITQNDRLAKARDILLPRLMNGEITV